MLDGYPGSAHTQPTAGPEHDHMHLGWKRMMQNNDDKKWLYGHIAQLALAQVSCVHHSACLAAISTPWQACPVAMLGISVQSHCARRRTHHLCNYRTHTMT